MITLSKKLRAGAPAKKEEEIKRISVRDKLLVKGENKVVILPLDPYPEADKLKYQNVVS